MMRKIILIITSVLGVILLIANKFNSIIWPNKDDTIKPDDNEDDDEDDNEDDIDNEDDDKDDNEDDDKDDNEDDIDNTDDIDEPEDKPNRYIYINNSDDIQVIKYNKIRIKKSGKIKHYIIKLYNVNTLNDKKQSIILNAIISHKNSINAILIKGRNSLFRRYVEGEIILNNGSNLNKIIVSKYIRSKKWKR